MTSVISGVRTGRLDPAADMGFDERSAIRRVTSEPMMGFAVQRALVMEIAHTKVGTAVDDHSRFRTAPVRRLLTTLDAGVRLVFGSPPVSRMAARQIYRFHDHVNGPIPAPHGPDGEHGDYTAHDAELLTWVWATLVDSCAALYDRWVGLPPVMADDFFTDMVTFARCFGIPADLLPSDRAALDRYVSSTLASDDLCTAPTSRRMVDDVLHFAHWNVPPAVVRPLRVVAIGTLDPVLRDRLQLSLSERDRRLFGRIDHAMRHHYRRLPSLRRALPPVYLALRRPTIGLKDRLRGRPLP